MTESTDSSGYPTPDRLRSSLGDLRVTQVLDYLQHDLPRYPFDEAVDRPFVEELVEDFDHVDILEQLKRFRWFHNNAQGSHVTNLRLALRRWLARSWSR